MAHNPLLRKSYIILNNNNWMSLIKISGELTNNYNLAPGGGTPRKIEWGMWPTSQNPFPIYDQNLQFSIPYLWPHQNFGTLFMTWSFDQYPVLDLPYN